MELWFYFYYFKPFQEERKLRDSCKKEKEEGKTGERRRGSAAEKNTGIKEAERDGVQTEVGMGGKEGERLSGIRTKLNVNFLIPFYSVFCSPSSVGYQYLLFSLEIVTKPVTVLLCFLICLTFIF